MAAKVPKWGKVETEMMNSIFDPEILRSKVPGMGDIIDGAAHLRALHHEIGTLGKYREALGFDEGHNFQRVSKIDTEIVVMLDHLHEAGCDCGKGLWGTDGHKAWYYKWLQTAGKWSDVRGKIQLTV